MPFNLSLSFLSMTLLLSFGRLEFNVFISLHFLARGHSCFFHFFFGATGFIFFDASHTMLRFGRMLLLWSAAATVSPFKIASIGDVLHARFFEANILCSYFFQKKNKML